MLNIADIHVAIRAASAAVEFARFKKCAVFPLLGEPTSLALALHNPSHESNSLTESLSHDIQKWTSDHGPCRDEE